MKYSELKNLKKTFGAGWRVIVASIGEIDFSTDSYRFIRADFINQYLVDELSGNHYHLGCFESWFIADVTGWPVELIDAAQKGGAYEAIGEAIEGRGHLERMVDMYVCHDGYGHHFNAQNGNQEIAEIDGVTYYYFDA
jgi:hypothetical protein